MLRSPSFSSLRSRWPAWEGGLVGGFPFGEALASVQVVTSGLVILFRRKLTPGHEGRFESDSVTRALSSASPYSGLVCNSITVLLRSTGTANFQSDRTNPWGRPRGPLPDKSIVELPSSKS